ncbi:MAG: hypothetical protein NTZ26_10925 [Candidatus Aminicenantes bacterium]|nr:hypothetical protein [Candidatus Aminicenantes bacterium]
MDLIERYLNAVGFWLPKNQKKDILSELSEDIRSQVEERETELGRALAEEDLSTLLKQRGSPFTVAGRFLPQRHLIGPQLYPIYEFVLKLAGGIYLVPWFLIWAGLMIFVPSYRSAHSGSAIFQALGSLWTTAWTLLAMITLGFGIGERVQRKSTARGDWNPRRLPAVRNTLKVPRTSSLAEIVINPFVLIWWLGGFSLTAVLSRDGVPAFLKPSPLWLDFRTRYFIPIAVFIVVVTVLALVNLIRPNLTPFRVGVTAVIDASVPVMIFQALGVHSAEIRTAWDAMTGGAAGPDKMAAIRDWSIAVTLGIIGLACLFSCFRGILRIRKWNEIQARIEAATKA